MQTKFSPQAVFPKLRTLLALLFCAAMCFIAFGTFLSSFHSEALADVSGRTLTFAERVGHQRAIEDVYWRHRIWPKDRHDPKPSLDAVMSQAQLEKKVTDYLRNSQALEDHWRRPITAEQLQAEMDRMAKHTKQPDVLRELFEALGNDPFVIAECLARPALAERLLTNWYAYDQKIHGKLKQRAEAELKARPSIEQMKQLSGNYSEIELVKGDNLREQSQQKSKNGLMLNSREWDQTLKRLTTIFSDHSVAAGVSPAGALPAPAAMTAAQGAAITEIRIGALSSLQEDERSYYATGVINKTKDRLKLATVAWLKEPLDSWRARAQSAPPFLMAGLSRNYVFPAIFDGTECVDDTWTATIYSPVGRFYFTSVWTGTEMIVWGGYAGGPAGASGGAYNPSTDTWAETSMINAPAARLDHTAVWTGSEMIIWGGHDQNLTDLNTGGRYNPGTNTWTPTSLTNAPVARVAHTAVWAVNEMIIWGGYNGGTLSSGGRYNPNTDSWTTISSTNAPSARALHTAVWTDKEMIVWGGAGGGEQNTGGRYNPSTDSWTTTSTTNAPIGRDSQTAVWTNNEMIIWGGFDGTNDVNTGGRYNPSTNSWTSTSMVNAPSGRFYHTAVWTGSEMIVWGGAYFDGSNYIPLNTGGRYNPGTDGWIATDTANAPTARQLHTAVWTGSEMIVWGGLSEQLGAFNSGARYTPDTDSWVPTAAALSERESHTAVWTGNEMIVWGGYAGTLLDTGGRYNPGTDSWTATTTTNAPAGRDLHTAVWSGAEMIVWGGQALSDYSNTGGKYNPSTDSWTPTSITNAPDARWFHTAVWDGSEMIIWGGVGDSGEVNSGGRYNPSVDSWRPTNANAAPARRQQHTAVWTGSEMLVWGGASSDPPFYLDTGGKYNPTADSWVATNTIGAPSGRESHTAVWAENRMIIWGGFDLGSVLDTGGSYDPSTDSWTNTSMANAPSARFYHTAVWTGSEMIVWGGQQINFDDANTGRRYDPGSDSWATTSTTNVPGARELHTAVWTGSEMIVWGGFLFDGGYLDTGGRYCAQSGPTPTPTPTPRATPRPRPTPHPRPTPR